MGAELVLIAASMLGAEDVTLVQFSADWCKHCRGMKPTVDRLEDDGYPIVRVDVDRQKEAIRSHRVRALPTFVLMQGGKELKRLEGEVSYAQLTQLFEEVGYRTRQSAKERQASNSRANSKSGGLLSGALNQIKQAAATTQAELDPPSRPAPSESAPLPAAANKPSKARAQQKALQASVRLRIEDATGYSFGTGTIIDTHAGDALILTCGHIFRDSKGKGQILVQIFTPSGVKTVEGKLIEYEPDYRDIGLVAIRPGDIVEAVRVVSAPSFRPRDAVFSIGCDRGADPSIREGKIVSLDRFAGSPNIEVTGRPVVGRSGGGLFNSAGELIGVCKLANASENEGIYAAVQSVHFHLDKVGLSKVYQGSPSPPSAVAADTPSPSRPTHLAGAAAAAANTIPITPAKSFGGRANADVRPANRTNVGNVRQPLAEASNPRASNTPAALMSLARDAEMIVIVRPKNDPANSQVMVVDEVTDELLGALRRAVGRHRGTARTPNIAKPLETTGLRTADERGRLMRAQSEH